MSKRKFFYVGAAILALVCLYVAMNWRNVSRPKITSCVITYLVTFFDQESKLVLERYPVTFDVTTSRVYEAAVEYYYGSHSAAFESIRAKWSNKIERINLTIKEAWNKSPIVLSIHDPDDGYVAMMDGASACASEVTIFIDFFNYWPVGPTVELKPGGLFYVKMNEIGGNSMNFYVPSHRFYSLAREMLVGNSDRAMQEWNAFTLDPPDNQTDSTKPYSEKVISSLRQGTEIAVFSFDQLSLDERNRLTDQFLGAVPFIIDGQNVTLAWSGVVQSGQRGEGLVTYSSGVSSYNLQSFSNVSGVFKTEPVALISGSIFINKP